MPGLALKKSRVVNNRAYII